MDNKILCNECGVEFKPKQECCVICNHCYMNSLKQEALTILNKMRNLKIK